MAKKPAKAPAQPQDKPGASPPPEGGKPARDAQGRLLPGHSGNPGGRPKGFANLIREQTEDGAELVRIALATLRGELTRREWMGASEGPLEVVVTPTVKESLDALKWLADRGWGKAVETVELSGPDGQPLQSETKVTSEPADPKRIAAVIGILARAGFVPPGSGTGGASGPPDAPS